MPLAFSPALENILSLLNPPNATLDRTNLEPNKQTRTPIHVLYGGAHLFKRDAVNRLGKLARDVWARYAPDASTFAKALDLPLTETLQLAHARTTQKLIAEPIEDLRIDFEDGFGLRPDAEEDATAIRCALEVAAGLQDATLPPMLGVRIKNLGNAHKYRAARTLDLFFSTLCQQTGGRLPDSFVVTLPKVASPIQVEVCARLLEYIETSFGLSSKQIGLELMIELPDAIFSADGRLQPLNLIHAANGRCTSVHFGTYDFTATCDISAPHQTMQHPICDSAKHLLQIALASSNVRIADGATTFLPIEAHKGLALSPAQEQENQSAVWNAWRMSWNNIQHSLRGGFYQGWDLHPAQLPIRYAATYQFFLDGLQESAQRLRTFIDHAAHASRVGCAFDDAATGQGLQNFFRRGLSCGALCIEEVHKLGLQIEEIQQKFS
jgi:citrate lyase beta subunit